MKKFLTALFVVTSFLLAGLQPSAEAGELEHGVYAYDLHWYVTVDDTSIWNIKKDGQTVCGAYVYVCTPQGKTYESGSVTLRTVAYSDGSGGVELDERCLENWQNKDFPKNMVRKLYWYIQAHS